MRALTAAVPPHLRSEGVSVRRLGWRVPVGLIEAIARAAAAQDPAYAALGLDLLGWFRLGLRSESDARACAAAHGVTVVQPAGNGARDLGGLLPPDGEDSGAIVVSAAVHEPAGWVCEPASNHGARADCFASGRGVVTTSLFLDTARSATAPTIVPTITDAFANTSAAGAIVAGCAVAVQGMVRARWGVPGSVAGVRTLLRAHGTPAGPGPAIGVMPDLAAIAAALAAAPAPP